MDLKKPRIELTLTWPSPWLELAFFEVNKMFEDDKVFLFLFFKAFNI